MGLHLADAVCGEEPHWKLSPEATRQVMLVCTNLMPDTYDVCHVHTGKRQGAIDYVTLAHHWQIPLHKAKNMVERTMQ